jgi:hypothetical protein
MSLLDSTFIQCPYCWESIEVEVDASAARQEYVEDCHVCCQPILFKVAVDKRNRATVSAKREND